MDKADQYLDVIRALLGVTCPGLWRNSTNYLYRESWSDEILDNTTGELPDGCHRLAVITTDANGIVDARRWDGG